MTEIKCKRSAKETEAVLTAAGLEFTKNTAKTGTVYITVELPDFETIDIRISDHASVAGGYSHDGRTQDYTLPDFEIDRAGNGLAELCEELGVELPASIKRRFDRAIKAAGAAREKEAEALKARVKFAADKEAGMAARAAELGLSEEYERMQGLTGKARKRARYDINAAIKKTEAA